VVSWGTSWGVGWFRDNPGTVLVVRDVNSRARNHGGVKDGGNDQEYCSVKPW